MIKSKLLLTIRFTLIALLFFALGACKLLSSNKNIELIKAIPKNVSFIIKTNNIAKLDSTLFDLPYKEVVAKYSWLNTLKTNHQSLSSVLSKVSNVDSNYAFPMVASLHIANASELNSINYYPLSISKKAFKRIVDENFSAASKQQWQYQNTTITEILITELERKITIAYVDNILITSPVSFLVEDAVKQLNSSSDLLSDNSFKKVYNKENNTADVNLWFNFQNMEKWISTFSTRQGVESLTNFDNFAAWMLLDIYFNEDHIFMSGLTSTKSSNTLNHFSEKSKCNHSNASILPFNTAVESHFSQIPDSLKNYAKAANIKDCWTKVLIEPLNSDELNNWVVVFETIESKESTEENLTALEEIGKRILKKEQIYVKDYKEYLLVASNDNSLQNYYNSIKSNQALSKDETYASLQENLKADANVNFYARSIYTKEALRSIYRNDTDFLTDFENLRGFNQITFQFSKEGDQFLTNAQFTFSDHDISGHTNIVWKTNLNEPVMAGPQIVTINNNGDKGVLVQDEAFLLYLIGKGGNIIWTKQLNSQWFGDAHNLKLYNDNSIQLTFNTQLNWYLVDETANDIVGFPLKFKDDANTGLTITKIKGKDCAFIGFSNENVYGYEINGKPLKGWNPQNKVGNLIGGVQAIPYKGNIYLSALNKEGKLFIWDANGKKIKSTAFSASFPSPPFADVRANPFKMKNVKSNGELVSFNARGNVGKYKLPVSSVDQFMMANITGNSDPEIILSNGTRVTVFSYTGKKIFSKNTKGQMLLIHDKGKAKAILAIVDKIGHSIILLDNKGKVLSQPDFYVGNKICSGNLLGDDQMSILSNGQTNEITCYRISLDRVGK